MNDKITATREGIIKQYQDSGITVILEIPTPNEKRDKTGIDDIKRILNNELLLQIGN